MLLTIEIGNSTVSAAAFDEAAAVATWRSDTHGGPSPTAVLRGWLEELPQAPAAAVVAGVVPVAVAAWRHACRRAISTVGVVDETVPRPLAVRYEPPRSLGVDRVLGAFAAVQEHGAPVLVADCGTATTLDAVTADGVFAGGAILCGIGLQRDALAQRTALLPEVPLMPPRSRVGRNTATGLQVGLIAGHAGAIAWLAEQMRAELDVPAAPLVATGGYGELVAAAAPGLFAAVDPLLTLRGLRLAWLRHAAEETA